MKKITLDNVLLNVGKFNGDIKDHRTYERAKANLEAIGKDKGISLLEENLKKESGYDAFDLPREPQEYHIAAGDVEFKVRTETTTKRPQYKAAAVQMENYIDGIRTIVYEGEVITGIAKNEDKKWCIGVDTLLEQYKVIVAGVKSIGLKQTIKYETTGEFANEKTPKELDLKSSIDGTFTADNFRDYVRKDRMKEISEDYVKDYEKELKKSGKVANITPVNTRKGYEEKSTKTEGANWAYVVKTLVGDDETIGELSILADPNISLTEKRKELPFYELCIREPFKEKTLYVTLESVYNRIQDLKDQEKVTSNKTKYVSKEIV